MGADYIHTSLYALAEVTKPTDENPHPRFDFARTLSWPAGEAAARSWCLNLSDEALERYVNESYVDFEAETPAEQKVELLGEFLSKLAELRESLGMAESKFSWREVGWSTFEVADHPGVLLVEFSTGGMSHGDSPTDAFDLFCYFERDGREETGILQAVGFLDWGEVKVSVSLPKDKMHWLNPSIP